QLRHPQVSSGFQGQARVREARKRLLVREHAVRARDDVALSSENMFPVERSELYENVLRGLSLCFFQPCSVGKNRTFLRDPLGSRLVKVRGELVTADPALVDEFLGHLGLDACERRLGKP